MTIEIGPVAVEREHEEKFRVHTRRGNLRNGQLFDRRIQRLAKLHDSHQGSGGTREPDRYTTPAVSCFIFSA
jgi:hypothetical protein